MFHENAIGQDISLRVKQKNTQVYVYQNWVVSL